MGERYGWVPTQFPVQALSQQGWVQFHTGKSVTDLEMVYGVFTKPPMRSRAFFYFRDPAALAGMPDDIRSSTFAETGPERIGQLADLKERIRRAGRLKHYRLLHLATHGQIDEDSPGRSALVLAASGLARKAHGGLLTARQLLGAWQLDADLVVLSACETGLGRHAEGNGLVGFAHVFLACGARSVVLSRWKVDDTATALLMVRFYENLLGKRKELRQPMGRAEALQEAKKWLAGLKRQEAGEQAARLGGGVLRGTEGEARPVVKGKGAKLPEGERPFAHPYYWAAFVLVGGPA